MNNATDILTYLSDNKPRLTREYKLTKIGLFGSMVQGKQTDKSDIDLAVEFEPCTEDLYGLKNSLKKEIQAKFHRQVDICRFKYMKPFIRQRIESEIRYV